MPRPDLLKKERSLARAASDSEPNPDSDPDSGSDPPFQT